jgi:tetratricopeptide (TPR) repeat protein
LTAFEIMDAEECLGHWLDWKPDSIVAHFWLAQVRERTDNLEGALKELRTVVQYAPDHLQGRLRLARILLKSGQVEESLTEYSRCLEVAPDDASVLLAVADCQLRLGNMEQATNLLYTVLEVEDLPPGLRSTAQSELGRLALEEGRVDEALERLQEGVQLSPRNSGIRYSYGLALAKAGRAEEAKKEFDKSTQLTEQFGTLIDLSRELFRKPKDVEVRRKIGEGLYDLGYIDEAAGWLRTVIWIDPTDAHSHRLLAEYYEKRGDHERSIHHLQVAEGKAVSIPSDGLDPAHLGPSAELSFENESLDARPKLDGR